MLEIDVVASVVWLQVVICIMMLMMHKTENIKVKFRIESVGKYFDQVHGYTCSTFGFRRWITKEVGSKSGKLKLL